ncbi:MAG: O-antigen ligase family protein [Saprospiraceae bacterium]|nr:O-antigen ligase family protein [Saprospiraceae bacterium]
MKHLNEATLRQYYCLLACIVMLGGMIFSKVLLSMGMIGLVMNAVFDRRIGEHFRRFLANPALVGLTLIFFIFLLSGLNSANTDWLIDRLRMRVPFLVLPFAMVAIPRLGRQEYFGLLYFFLLLISGVCLCLMGWYLLHFHELTAVYRLGQVLPTPGMHIHFSLMTAFSVAIAWELIRQGFHWRNARVERGIQAGLLVFLVIFLHILAVRSGLVVLYLMLLYLLAHFILTGKRYRTGLAIVLLMAVGLVLAYEYVPTLRNKVDYTLYNLHMIRGKTNLSELSDSYRVANVEAGIAIGNAHPWTGVGIGDIRDETEAYLLKHYPELAGPGYMPQSQYVLTYAATGILGLLCFMLATIYPLWRHQSWRWPLFTAFHLMSFSVFAFEQLLETQVGAAIYLVFALLSIRFLMETDQTGDGTSRRNNNVSPTQFTIT